MKQILIVSVENDIHAMAVANEINKNKIANAHILETDRLSSKYAIAWLPDSGSDSYLTLGHGVTLPISEIDSIWWRRSRSDQRLDLTYTESQIDLINNDWRGSIRGALETGHKGAWISHPSATELASNKLVQLSMAQSLGIKTPRTLVSNDPNLVREFVREIAGGVIAKPIVGTKHSLLFTQLVDSASLTDEAISCVPAIYQECVRGTDHLRINCFGETMHASIIRTNDLDWRRNLNNSEIRDWQVPDKLAQQIRNMLDGLNLAMGIFDFKVTPDGEIIWFEINPQGQFLFLEGLTKAPLLKEFSAFLANHVAVQPNNSFKPTPLRGAA